MPFFFIQQITDTHARVFKNFCGFTGKEVSFFELPFYHHAPIDKFNDVCYSYIMKKIKLYKASSNRSGNILKEFLQEHRPYDMVIECFENDEKLEKILGIQRNGVNFATLKEQLRRHVPLPRLILLSGFDSVAEIVELLAPVRTDIDGLSLFKCPDLTDFAFLEDFPRLKTLQIYWNRKVKKIFNAARMPALLKFHMTDCNNIVDFSGLRGSNLEFLTLYGCNGCGSFTPRLDIGDPDFLTEMPRLKHLSLDIMRTRADDVYLKTLAKIKSLESLELKKSFFTFEQFAWLSAHLPNVKESLAPCSPVNSSPSEKQTDGTEEFFIIGRHKTYVKAEKAEKYRIAYDRLRTEFKDADKPPAADFKIKI